MSQILECYSELLDECDRAMSSLPYALPWIFFSAAAGLLVDRMTEEERAEAYTMQQQRYAKRIG